MKSTINSILFIFVFSTVFTVKFQAVGKEQKISALIQGPGLPPKGYFNRKKQILNINKLKSDTDNVKILDTPAFSWTYGCSPTSAGMLIGYYDRNGYPNLYTGSENSGICPVTNKIWGAQSGSGDSALGECPFIASEEHIKDFFESPGKDGDNYYGKNDPHCKPGAGNCLADYMGTSMWYPEGKIGFDSYIGGDPYPDYEELKLFDGASAVLVNNYQYEMLPYSATGFGDLCYGIKLFIESQGYKVDTYFNQRIYKPDYPDMKGYTFEEYVTEIDAGRPVIIHLMGHSMLGVGYNKDGNKIYFHNTWDFDLHEMDWGGYYSNMKHVQVSVIHLAPNDINTHHVTIASNNDSYGSVKPSSNFLLEQDQTFQLNAETNYGYRLVKWTAEPVENAAFSDEASLKTEVSVSGNVTITAVFEELPKYTVTFICSNSEYGSLDFYGLWSEQEVKWTVYEGEDCHPVEVNNRYSDYPFLYWKGDMASSDNPLTVKNVTKDMTVTAYFGEEFTVTFKSGEHGSLSGSTEQTIIKGASCTSVLAVPDDHYQFDKWTGSIESSENPLTVSGVTENMSLEANFIPKQYTIIFTCTEDGQLKGETEQLVSYGNDCSAVTAEADDGYEFIGWTGDIKSSENPLTISSVNGDLTIHAKFSKIVTHTVTFVANAGGTVSGTTVQTIRHGAAAEAVVAVPDPFYKFVSWNGDFLSNSSMITIKDVQYDMLISANFERDSNLCAVTIQSSSGGNVDNSGTVPIETNGSLSINAVPDSGCIFTGWIAVPAANASFSDSNSSATNVTIYDDVVISALFTADVTLDIQKMKVSINGSSKGKIRIDAFLTGYDPDNDSLKLILGNWSVAINPDDWQWKIGKRTYKNTLNKVVFRTDSNRISIRAKKADIGPINNSDGFKIQYTVNDIELEVALDNVAEKTSWKLADGADSLKRFSGRYLSAKKRCQINVVGTDFSVNAATVNFTIGNTAWTLMENTGYYVDKNGTAIMKPKDSGAWKFKCNINSGDLNSFSIFSLVSTHNDAIISFDNGEYKISFSCNVKMKRLFCFRK